MTDYYSVLEVPRNAPLEIIKAAYRRLCKLFHPDKNPGNAEAEARMKEINVAWEVLGDDTKRRTYDTAWVRRTQEDAARRKAQADGARAQQRSHASAGPQTSPNAQWWKENWGWVLAGLVLLAMLIVAISNTGGKKPRARYA